MCIEIVILLLSNVTNKRMISKKILVESFSSIRMISSEDGFITLKILDYFVRVGQLTKLFKSRSSYFLFTREIRSNNFSI